MTIDQDQLAATLADARAKAGAAREQGRYWRWDRAYFARMDPATTLLLLDAVERLRGERDEADDTANMRLGMLRSARRRAEAAEAAYAAMGERLGFEQAEVARLLGEAAALRERLANVRALAGDLFARAPEQRTDQWHARLEVARDILIALDGPQDGGPNWTAIRGEGYMPQDGGDGR